MLEYLRKMQYVAISGLYQRLIPCLRNNSPSHSNLSLFRTYYFLFRTLIKYFLLVFHLISFCFYIFWRELRKRVRKSGKGKKKKGRKKKTSKMEEPLRLLLFEQSDTSNQNQWMFSKKSSIEHGVPQDSVLGSLLFNIDLIDLFYECEESNIASYAHDAPFRPVLIWFGMINNWPMHYWFFTAFSFLRNA